MLKVANFEEFTSYCYSKGNLLQLAESQKLNDGLRTAVLLSASQPTLPRLKAVGSWVVSWRQCVHSFLLYFTLCVTLYYTAFSSMYSVLCSVSES